MSGEATAEAKYKCVFCDAGVKLIERVVVDGKLKPCCFSCKAERKQAQPPKPKRMADGGLNPADFKPGTVVPCEICGIGVFASKQDPAILGCGDRCSKHTEAAIEMAKILEREEAFKAEQTKDAMEAGKMKDSEYELGIRKDGSALVGIKMSDVKSKRMKFIWDGRIPASKGVVIHGEPGKGKSQVTLSMAAIISTGADWPDGAKNTMGPRKVLIAGTEDDVEDTIKPRLQAAGANMENITWLVRSVRKETDGKIARRILLKEDMKNLHKALLDDKQIAAVIFDPITGYYGDQDGNSNKDIRATMEQLADVCRRTGVSVFAIIHENRRTDVSAINKILGAGALGQVFRVAFRFSKAPGAKDKHDFIMAPSKENNTKQGGALRYRTEGIDILLDDGSTAEMTRVVWGETHDMDADQVILELRKCEREELIAASVTDIDKMKAALLKEVSGGRKKVSDMHRVREEVGVGKETMYAAKRALGLVTTDAQGSVLSPQEAKRSGGTLYWGLAGDVTASEPTNREKIIEMDDEAL